MKGPDVSVSIREWPDGDLPYQTAIIRSHWVHRDDKFRLELEGKTYTFRIDDFEKALRALKESA